ASSPSLSNKALRGPEFVFNPNTGTYYNGVVTFHNNNSGKDISSDILAGVDASWDANLDQTLVLFPGNYNVKVVFNDANYEYMGLATSIDITESGSNNIALTVNPVIGSSLTNVSVTNSISKFSLNYPAADFTSLPNPEMVVTIDNDTTNDTALSLNQFTGAERLYIKHSNLDGTHDIYIELQSGGIPVAKVSSSTHFRIGEDLTLNLIPIFGTINFDVSESGSDATFDFVLPAMVISMLDNESGGKLGYDANADYYVQFQMTGSKNAAASDILTFVDVSGDYHGSFTLPAFQYDNLGMSIEVWDTMPTPFKIADCAFQIDVTKDTAPVSCGLTLRRRSMISGRYMHALGVNVINTDNRAELNSLVFANGELKGITGGAGVNDGFVTIFLEPDSTYDIYSTDASRDGTSDVFTNFITSPGGIDNLMLFLK
ncbi:MAG: hypothetical protein GY786_05980, partial [Proteobacteria bacterium]|nr:hypothetical protein [Pseudomonadota bacterium]